MKSSWASMSLRPYLPTYIAELVTAGTGYMIAA